MDTDSQTVEVEAETSEEAERLAMEEVQEDEMEIERIEDLGAAEEISYTEDPNQLTMDLE